MTSLPLSDRLPWAAVDEALELAHEHFAILRALSCYSIERHVHLVSFPLPTLNIYWLT